MIKSIGTSSTPATDRLHESTETVLTREEKGNIAKRLGAALAATGCLIVGSLYSALIPDQKDIADLVLLVGSLIAALPVLRSAIDGLRSRPCQIHEHEHDSHFGDSACACGDSRSVMDQLVSIAVIASIVTGEYSTAILVPLLMAISHFLEERSVVGAHAAIEGLKRLRATTATVAKPDGSEETVSLEALTLGDRIIVRPGEILPADGKVIEGYSAVDQSAVTGEASPEDVDPGSSVFAGTTNVSGLLTVEVTGLGDKTAIGRVTEMLRQAEQSKAPITQILERYAGFYLPFVLIVAVAVVLLTRDMSRAVAVLVVACPCAMVISGSTAMIAALAAASRSGILIKNTKFLEALSDVRTLILDKTGTVTLGQLDLVGVHLTDGVTQEELLSHAAVCAQGSRHPISRAIAKEAEHRAMPISAIQDMREFPGKGVEVRSNGDILRMGNAMWLEISRDQALGISHHTGPVVWLSRNGSPVGAILLADRPRPESRGTVEALRKMGIDRVLLLTGDREEVARETAAFLEVDEYRSELLPVDKLKFVESEASKGHRIMVVGDGINDALALARADVGVAMGAMGSDIAIQSADIALMTNDIRRLSTSMRLAQLTRATININVAVGALSAATMIVLASTGYVGAVWGVFLHNISAAAVVINSARILRTDIDGRFDDVRTPYSDDAQDHNSYRED